MNEIKDWFLSLPRPVLGSVAVLGGIAFMLLADPPKTVCDTQFESYRERLAHHIFPKNVSSSVKLPPLIETQYRDCMRSNSPGGCYELFQGIKTWLRELRTITSGCGSEFGKIAPSKEWMSKSITLFVQIAWGDNPPETFRRKTGWLERSDIILYCGLKREYVRLFGTTEWTNLRESILQSLPGASKMDRLDRWEKTILSVACEKILNLPE